MWRYLVKGIFVPGLISSMLSLSDADLSQLAAGNAIIIIDAGHEDRCYHGGQNPNAKRYRKSLNRSGTELKENHTRKKSSHDSVDDCGQSVLEAGFYGRARSLAKSEFLPDPFIAQHVRGDRRTVDQDA